ncbi:MAG: tRNA (adenosine(37)-N6)-threonylcarbamoyltransferase complex ATPase subunit type 1 TsaE [Parachlamydiales bacterium]|nr:tRNA (adenosine(37)-N6)-threonylcarbamoyltransferase complex ATPase subunit type 1 TsaE [Parachlamydiales bacterium]
MRKTIIETFRSFSPEETQNIGKEIAKHFSSNDIVAFFGDLGAGKTLCIKGIVSSLSSISPSEITSPTFTYLHLYQGSLPIYHFDLYRLKNSHHFIDMGFDEFFHQGGLCLIEWAEQIADLLFSCYIIEINHIDESQREILFSRLEKEKVMPYKNINV